MNVLPDTNILLRSAEPGHPMHADATASVARLESDGYVVCLVPQLIYEFWVVATRPTAQNGLGKSPAEAAVLVRGFRARFALCPDNDRILPEWENDVVTHAVTGKPAHDARLVAAMKVHGITRILTFNDADFRRYPGITVLTPVAVLAAGP